MQLPEWWVTLHCTHDDVCKWGEIVAHSTLTQHWVNLGNTPLLPPVPFPPPCTCTNIEIVGESTSCKPHFERDSSGWSLVISWLYEKNNLGVSNWICQPDRIILQDEK